MYMSPPAEAKACAVSNCFILSSIPGHVLVIVTKPTARTRTRLHSAKALESRITITQVRIGAHENHLSFAVLVFFYWFCNSLCRFSDFLVACGNRSGTH